MSITWGGVSWEVADRAAGGPYACSFKPSQVTIAPDGSLVLKVSRNVGAPIGAEIAATVETGWGYGTYRIAVGSTLSGIHQSIVVGNAFLYGSDDPAGEMDLGEVSAWSGMTGPWYLGQSVWMPALGSRGGYDTARVPVMTDSSSCYELVWEPTRVTFRAYRGTTFDPALLFRESVVRAGDPVTFPVESGGTYTGPAIIPVPGGKKRPHINLWVIAAQYVGGADPATVTDTEIIFRSFSYVPAGAPMPVTDVTTIKAVSRTPNLDLTAAGTPVPGAGAGNGIRFQNNGRRLLRVRNTTGSSVTVSVKVPTTVDGLGVVDLTATVAATTGDRLLGPFPAVYNDSAGRVLVEFSSAAAGVSFDVIDVPSA